MKLKRFRLFQFRFGLTDDCNWSNIEQWRRTHRRVTKKSCPQYLQKFFLFLLIFPYINRWTVNTHKKRFATLIDDDRETRFLPVFDSVLFDVLGTVSIVDFDGSQWNNWKIDQDQHFYGISFNCFFSFGRFRTESTKYSFYLTYTLSACMYMYGITFSQSICMCLSAFIPVAFGSWELPIWTVFNVNFKIDKAIKIHMISIKSTKKISKESSGWKSVFDPKANIICSIPCAFACSQPNTICRHSGYKNIYTKFQLKWFQYQK